MIKGITHDSNGNPRVRRTVTTKLAIGLPPEGSRNYPTKLDHIAFLKKVYEGKEIKWVVDQELTEHYKQQAGTDQVRSVWVTFMDNDIETVLRSQWGAYKVRGLWCRGDGETAMRRPGRDNEWNPLAAYSGKCANAGCPVAEAGECKPNGTLYFFLRDFPTLGSLCKLQTTSWQSIQQIYSALQDLRSVTGGRLLGVSAKLFIHPDKTVYEQGGNTKTGMKWCWGLELAAADLAGMGTKLLEAARSFNEIRGELSGRVLEVEEDDAEVAQEMRAEFYPAGESQEVAAAELAASDPDKDMKDKITAKMRELGTDAQGNRFNDARIQAALAKHGDNLPGLLLWVETQLVKRNNAAEPAETKPTNGNGNKKERCTACDRLKMKCVPCLEKEKAERDAKAQQSQPTQPPKQEQRKQGAQEGFGF